MPPSTVGCFKALERWLRQRLLALTVGCEIGIYDSLAPQFCRLFCGAMARVMILLGYNDQT